MRQGLAGSVARGRRSGWQRRSRLVARASVRDVAAQTGLSIATVSRVINGDQRVAAPTRALVLDALDLLGPAAPVARGHGRQSGGPVFVRCPYELTDYFGLIVSAIADELAANGRPMLLDAGESSQSRHPLGQLSMRAESSGAILVLPPEETRGARATRPAWIPVRHRRPPHECARRRGRRHRGAPPGSACAHVASRGARTPTHRRPRRSDRVAREPRAADRAHGGARRRGRAAATRRS